jgi:3-phosphoglycerate kinase
VAQHLSSSSSGRAGHRRRHRRRTVDAVKRLKPGQLLLLENLRFHNEEEANDPEFAAALASYGDVYVNDAFGTAHRAHASTVGVAELLPAFAGLLMEREIRNLSSLLEDPARPFAAVIGGAKVSDKIEVLDRSSDRVDRMRHRWGMANTFLAAQDHGVGKSLLEPDRVEDARRIMGLAAERGVDLLLPTDVVVAKEVTRGAEHKVVPVKKIPSSWSAVDIGPESRVAFEAALADAMTVLWNGPLGVFEVPTFGDGTRSMARFLADRAGAGASVVVGGGDSVAAIEELGLASRFTHISTGGAPARVPRAASCRASKSRTASRKWWLSRSSTTSMPRDVIRGAPHGRVTVALATVPSVGRRAIGRLDGRSRSGGAARPRHVPLRRQGRPEGRDQRRGDHRAGHPRRGRFRPGRHRCPAHRARRDT